MSQAGGASARASGMPPASAQAEVAADRGLVTIVVPAKDEEQGIGLTLRSLPLRTLQYQGFRTEVLVLDGNSRDATPRIARQWGAEVVGQPSPGKGVAFRVARPRMRGDYVVMIDADATYAADAIPAMLEMLAAREADVVMGSRRKGRRAPGAMGSLNSFGNWALSTAASVLYLRRCSDVCTGLWGFRREALQALRLQGTGFELEVELFGRAARQGLRVREVPVDYMPRRGGTKLNRGADGLRIGWWLLRTRFAPARADTILPEHPVPSAGALEPELRA
jgi:glycosyltransferase involved in cell wall biosynthesis